jgi:hypothetical protein
MNANGDGGLDFDTLLEHELRRRVGRLRGPSPAVHQAAYHAGATGGKTTMVSSLTAAATSKIAVGLAAATALVVAGGSAAAAASHSGNPAAWGRTVTEAVAACKSQLGAGEHGIGQCVSAVARQHGQSQRDEHSADRDQQAQPASTPSPHGNGQDKEQHAKGGQSGHPTGKPSDAPTGSPAGHGSRPSGSPAAPEHPEANG